MAGHRRPAAGKCVPGTLTGTRVFPTNFGEYIHVSVLENGLAERIPGSLTGLACWEPVLSEYFLSEHSVNLPPI